MILRGLSTGTFYCVYHSWIYSVSRHDTNNTDDRWCRW